jgi:hypothetical protein
MRPIVLAGLALATATLLAGCSGSSSSDGRSLGSGGAAKAAPARAADAAGERANPAGGGAAKAPYVADAQSKIVKADISVSVQHADEVAARADQAGVIARRYGGDVYAEQRSGGAHAAATVTIKVRPADTTAALDDLAGLGKELDRHMSTEDVTQQVADVDSRVRSAQLAIDQLNALYSRASKVSDMIVIDNELAQRQSDLEALLAQQRALAHQTALATIDLSLSTAAATPAAAHHERTGFLGGLQRGWDAFTSAAGGLATGFGAALPFLVVLALLGAGGVYGYRRTRHPAPPQPAAE